MSEEQKPKRRGRRPWSEEERKLRAERRAADPTYGRKGTWSLKERQAHERTFIRKREELEAKRAQESAELKPAPKRSNRSHNVPARMGFGENEEDKVLISRLMTETLGSWRKPKVMSDLELAQRLDEFFHECAEMGKIPTMEEMIMCTGYSQTGYQDIITGRRNGFSPETKHIFRRAKDFLKTFDAKLVITGQINPIIYFFRAKNFYDMKDQQEVVLQGTDSEKEMSKEQIEEWYLEDGKTVVQEFPEDQEGGKHEQN